MGSVPVTTVELRRIIHRLREIFACRPAYWLSLEAVHLLWYIQTGRTFDSRGVGRLLQLLPRLIEEHVIETYTTPQGRLYLRQHPELDRRRIVGG